MCGVNAVNDQITLMFEQEWLHQPELKITHRPDRLG